jgi:glucosamine-6-phosphate deaminase
MSTSVFRQGHPKSYHSVVLRDIINPLGLSASAFLALDGSGPDFPAACAAYEQALGAAGGVDLQILGIGSDGHIGFHEPCSSLASRTRAKTLTRQTRVDNARFFDSLEQVPHRVLTQGIATILDARHVVLLATGEAKAEAVAAISRARFPHWSRPRHSSCTAPPPSSWTRRPPSG